ncbi:MAG: NUDIX hydrolase [Candidatus Azambacteria bacterium]|nr:NUDIX hydrolase [Candidatus Azambacteria bacterium]
MENHITTKVGVYCIIEKDGKILLAQEAKGGISGTWSIPGGKVDEGESFEEAVKREVKEETNLDVFDMEEMSIIQEEPNHTVKHIFIVKTDGEIAPQEGEILDVRWFSFEEVQEMKNELRKPWVLTIIEEYFNRQQ